MGCLRLTYSAEESPLRVSRDEEIEAPNWQVWVNETPAKKAKGAVDQSSGGDMNAVIGAFAKFLRLSGARQAEMDAAATGDYAGYTYDKVSGTFRPTKGQWRTRDPFVTLTNKEKVSGKGKFVIGDKTVQIGVFAFSPGAKHGSSVTGYDRSDNVNGYGHLPPGFNQGPGLILTAGGGSYQQAFLIFQSINSRKAFFNSYYTTQYNRTSQLMEKYKIK